MVEYPALFSASQYKQKKYRLNCITENKDKRAYLKKLEERVSFISSLVVWRYPQRTRVCSVYMFLKLLKRSKVVEKKGHFVDPLSCIYLPSFRFLCMDER